MNTLKQQINLNDEVEVVLTAIGAKIYNENWKDSIKMNRLNSKKEGDTLKAQLWSLFQDFGGHLHLGMLEVPFKDCEIYLKENK
jgi:hypothetical protein